MTSIEQFATRWLRWAFAATWQVGLLVCLIAVLTFLLRGASARLRYGLWLLVLVKIFLPTTLSVSWGVGHWCVTPLAALTKATNDAVAESPNGLAGMNQALEERVAAVLSGGSQSFSLAAVMLAIWAAGCIALWLAVGWRYWRLTQTTNSMRQIDEGPVRIELERLAERFAIRTAPAVFATEQSISPMLIGVIAPKIVLPESFLSRLSADELQMILAHELVHWRRRTRGLAGCKFSCRACFGFTRWCGSRTRGSGTSASVHAMKRCSAKPAAIATVTAKRLSECWPLPEAGAW